MSEFGVGSLHCPAKACKGAASELNRDLHRATVTVELLVTVVALPVTGLLTEAGRLPDQEFDHL